MLSLFQKHRTLCMLPLPSHNIVSSSETTSWWEYWLIFHQQHCQKKETMVHVFWTKGCSVEKYILMYFLYHWCTDQSVELIFKSYLAFRDVWIYRYVQKRFAKTRLIWSNKSIVVDVLHSGSGRAVRSSRSHPSRSRCHCPHECWSLPVGWWSPRYGHSLVPFPRTPKRVGTLNWYLAHRRKSQSGPVPQPEGGGKQPFHPPG